MKILVTGGAGFIGSNYIYYMRKNRPNVDLLCLDKLTYAGNLKTLAPLEADNRFRFIFGDITNQKAVFELFAAEKPNVVVNFAAESHVDRSIENPGVFIETNITGTYNLLEACRQFGVERFHQVSTDEVYGDLPIDRPDLIFSEQSPLKPSSPYSVSKASADMLCVAYQRTYGLPVTISRSSNNYGPYQFPEKLIPVTIIHALMDKPIPVYGEGLNVRDWLYVEDHCAAIELILEKGQSSQIYNIGGRCELRNIDIVRKILSFLDKSEELITYVADRKGHDRRYAVNPEMVMRNLGWTPCMEFEGGLQKTVEWYLTHRDWWINILSSEY